MAYHTLTLLWFSLLTGPNVHVDAVMGLACVTTVRPEGTRGWPSCVVPVQTEIIITTVCTEHQNLCDMVAKQPFDKKTLSDSSCMTLKKNQRHLVSFILFVYHVIEVCEYEWWVFSAEKQQQFIVSFPVCFTKLKPIYPTITRMISQSLYVI